MPKQFDFIIDKETPTTLLGDFDRFISYIDNNKVELSKSNAYIGRKHLYEMNKLVKKSAEDATPNRDQPAYPALNLFYYISISGGLAQVNSIKKDKRILVVNHERMGVYNNLTNTEKYMFLLETLWRDVDWRKLLEKTFPGDVALGSINRFLRYLMNQKPDKRIEPGREESPLFFNMGYLNIYLEYFGFFEVEENKDDGILRDIKLSFSVKTLLPSTLGVEMVKILYQKRKFIDWNNPRKTYNDVWGIISGISALFDDEEEIIEKEDNTIFINQNHNEPFLLPFKHIFKAGELENSLPPVMIQHESGIYTFTVYLYKDVWRKISISSEDTLFDLHNIIQKAFKFDDDHLYDFSIEKEGFNPVKYYSPMGDEGPFAEEGIIGSLGLRVGSIMRYLFDYGDSWKFDIVLENIEKTDKLPAKPKVIESFGKAPKQYDSYW